jgi:hypothetical protein
MPIFEGAFQSIVGYTVGYTVPNLVASVLLRAIDLNQFSSSVLQRSVTNIDGPACSPNSQYPSGYDSSNTYVTDGYIDEAKTEISDGTGDRGDIWAPELDPAAGDYDIALIVKVTRNAVTKTNSFDPYEVGTFGVTGVSEQERFDYEYRNSVASDGTTDWRRVSSSGFSTAFSLSSRVANYYSGRPALQPLQAPFCRSESGCLYESVFPGNEPITPIPISDSYPAVGPGDFADLVTTRGSDGKQYRYTPATILDAGTSDPNIDFQGGLYIVYDLVGEEI